MWENKTIINSDGYVVNLSVLLKDGEPYEFELEYNQQLVMCPTITYVKPKWTGTEWIESATEEEINEKKNEIPLWEQ